MTAISKIEAGKSAPARRPAKTEREAVSHNLNGQKLGRKGRVTRERILAAAMELINESDDGQVSLSAVARKASLGMTSLYVYFSDLTELLMALLEPVMREAAVEGGYYSLVGEYWPDERLEERCEAFVKAYYEFWARHSRLLHLRNNMADRYDERMAMARVRSAQPLIAEFRKQLAVPGKPVSTTSSDMASVLMTGIERAVTVATDPVMPALIERQFGPRNTNVLVPLARLLVLAVRDFRAAALAAG